MALGALGGLAGWLIVGGFPPLSNRSSRPPRLANETPAAEVDVPPQPRDSLATAPTLKSPSAAPAPSLPNDSLDAANSPSAEPVTGDRPAPIPALPPLPSPDETTTIAPSLPPPPDVTSEAPLIVPEPQIPTSVDSENLPVMRSPLAFTDVPKGFWARPYIDALTARGVLNGLPEGRFEPNRPITRAELAVQLANAFALNPKQVNKVFIDVPNDYWASAKIQKAVTMGFMTGYPEGDFRPEQTLPRLQILLALSAGLSLPAANAPETLLSQYQDADAIPAWAREQVAAAIAAGLITPAATTGNLLRPNEPATRAEVAALIYSALAYMGKVEALPSSASRSG